jgi:hypothetical protein
MHAIDPNRPAAVRPYAWYSVSVDPDPPRAGEVTRIGFPLVNTGPDELVVERIEPRIATFGMGMPWEDLDPIGPFHLPPDPRHVERVSVEWTPASVGHRCVRASIHVRGRSAPLTVGRNLDVIRAGAHESGWRVPFHVGNPGREPAPIELRVDGEAEVALQAALRLVGGRPLAERPLLLRPGEAVAVDLGLFAPPGAALDAVRRVEAYIGDRLIDGIEVRVLRPALVAPLGVRVPAEGALALVR